MSKMAERMLAKIRDLGGGGVSFVELVQAAGPQARGELEMHLPQCRNVVLWAGVSDAFIDAMEEIHPRIEPTYAHPLVYLHDGEALTLPLVKRLSKKGYTQPHWLPVTFRLRKPEGSVA